MPDTTTETATDSPSRGNFVVNFKLLLPQKRNLTGQICVSASSVESAISKARAMLGQQHPGAYLDYAFC